MLCKKILLYNFIAKIISKNNKDIYHKFMKSLILNIIIYTKKNQKNIN